MRSVESGGGALVLEAAQLLGVGFVRRDEATLVGESLSFLARLPLLRLADRHFPRAAALGLGVLQGEYVAPVGPLGSDLDGLLPPQPEGSLEPQAHGRYMEVGVRHPRQVVRLRSLRLADVGDVLPVADAVVVTIAGDDVVLADLLGPPAQFGHAARKKSVNSPSATGLSVRASVSACSVSPPYSSTTR